jgi:hypothetical protein
MISRKMKDAIQNSGLTVRDTLRVIESCRTSPSVSKNETVEIKVFFFNVIIKRLYTLIICFILDFTFEKDE